MRIKLDYPIRGDSKNKVCVFMMAANEQAVIKKCLDSLKPIAGMIVFQNNSPNPDSTCSIVENWCKENEISLYLYDMINEGTWDPALHRNDVYKKANEVSKFDWLFRMDCDEWCSFTDEGIDLSKHESHNILSPRNIINSIMFVRVAFFKKGTKLHWPSGQAAHEDYLMEEEARFGNLEGIQVHSINKMTDLHDDKDIFKKYYREALGLEKQVFVDREDKFDDYHLWYLAKSYFDISGEVYRKFWFPESHRTNCMERAIFFFKTWLKNNGMWGKGILKAKKEYINIDKTWLDYGYLAYLNIYSTKRSLGEDFNTASKYLHLAEALNPWRAEGLDICREVFFDEEDWYSLFSVTSKMKGIKNPFPECGLFVNSRCYHDTSPTILDNRALAAYWIARETKDEHMKSYYYSESVKDLEYLLGSAALTQALDEETTVRLKENLTITKAHQKDKL